MVNKLAHLFEFVNSDNPDILCISETWLCDEIADQQFEIPSYKLFRRDRDLSFYETGLFSNKYRGGVLAYIKEDLHPEVQENLSVNAELLWVKVHPSCASELLVGVCYRPEAAGVKYIDTICESINRINTQDVILVGDFNFRDIDWGNEIE